MANTANTGTCYCEVEGPIIFNTVAYQNAANMVYVAKADRVAAATAGTLVLPNGNPMFKSNYERMQFLHGKISLRITNGDSRTGTAPRLFPFDSN